MKIMATHADRKGRPQTLVRLQQRAELHKRYVAQIPKWRQPLIGYLLTLPSVGLAVALVLLEKELIHDFFFPGAPMFLAIVLVAFIWGTGPALFSVLLNTLALDYFYVPPFGQFTISTWSGMLQLLPFFLAGIVIAILSGQREVARRNALFAEQALYEHADELEQANKELEQVNQMKDQFLSMASHELKTPITSIRGQAQIMLRRLSKQKELPQELFEVRAALQRIDEQTDRLTALVDDLLDLSSIRAGKIELRFSRCDLTSICRSVVEDQRLLSGRSIELEVPDEPVMLKADSDRLGQVVTNLVSNAIKYSPDGSLVRVCVERRNMSVPIRSWPLSTEQEIATDTGAGVLSNPTLPASRAGLPPLSRLFGSQASRKKSTAQNGPEETVLIEVHDAGQGIAKEEQKRIFETFYRSPDAQTSKKSGWGLGLAICKDLVERHGGSIWCESRRGKGSTFFVELPLKGK